MTLSEIVVIGLFEVFAVMVIALLIVMVFNHQLHTKTKKLATQLHQLKETTRFLLNKLSLAESANPPPETVLVDAPQPIDDVEPEAIPTSTLDEADLKQKWGYLCDASISLVTEGSPEAADDLIEIVKVINSDLGLTDIIMPNAEPKPTATNPALDDLKQQATENIELISKLLSEKDAAESQVSVKETELEQLHRYLKESESCIGMLEEELAIANQKLDAIAANKTDQEDTDEMKNLIQRFTQESRDMLVCIETLERENAELRTQSNQT